MLAVGYNSYTSAARRNQRRGSYFQWEGFEARVCVQERETQIETWGKLLGGWVEICQTEIGVGRDEKPRLIVIPILCLMKVDFRSSP